MLAHEFEDTIADTDQGIGWLGVGLAALFLTARVGIRIKAFHRLYADDALAIFAWVLLLINTIIWQINKDTMYEIIAVTAGQLYPLPPDVPRNTELHLRRILVVLVFFYTGLWSIKLSFLLFFRRLGQKVRNQKIVWWTVLAITVATYFAFLGTIEYHCLAGSFEYFASKQLVSGYSHNEGDTDRSQAIAPIQVPSSPSDRDCGGKRSWTF